MDKMAKQLGASAFGDSKVKDKRFYVVYQGKRINFGSTSKNTFYDNHNKSVQSAWKARHTKIKNKEGQSVYTVKTSPSYWSYNLLWN
jgi:hypothetical protein